jgi:hypothetical protein
MDIHAQLVRDEVQLVVARVYCDGYMVAALSQIVVPDQVWKRTFDSEEGTKRPLGM